MRFRPWFSSRPSFRRLLALVFSVGILLLALVSAFVTATLSGEIVREYLLEQGRRATQTLAEQATLALLYASTENAEEPARTILGFPGVRGVALYDAEHRELFAKGQGVYPAAGEPHWPAALQFEQENDLAWYFVAPVYARRDSGEEASPFVAAPPQSVLLGHVRLVMGKETLHAMQNGILVANLGTAIGFSLIFLFPLLWITNRLTQPLKRLAEVMGKATAGEPYARAKIGGTREIIDMEAAFHSMMEVLQSREQQLVTARDSALESARLKGEFATNVSHELRTPLNAVLGMLELLQDMGLTARQNEYVTVARNAGDVLLKLIEEVLDFSRLGADMMKPKPADFVLHELCDEVMGLLANQAQRKELELDYLIGDGVPLSLHGESARLRQVLVNLIGNAIKFTERGSIELKIVLGKTLPNKVQLRFEVIDTGIGISREARKRIFDPFVQADGSSTRHYEGAGLGLAICRQLVEFMGGEIGVDSEPGKGSRFWFSAPFETIETIEGRALRAPEDSSVLVGIRILIVTREEKMRHFLAQTFKRWNMPFRHAKSCARALEILRAASAQRQPYQFAILDQTTLGSKVLELSRALQGNPDLAELKVVFISHYSAAAPGEPPPPNVVACLNKPLRVSQLYDCFQPNGMKAVTPLPAPAPRREPIVYFGKHVLVVEDNPASQQVAMGMLERLGCRVDVAENGQEALSQVLQCSHDLLLMDCHMPRMDGYQATREIRRLENGSRHVPIVAMTANVQQEDQERCIASGMDDYLAKPLQLSQLREKLAYWFARSLANGRKLYDFPVSLDIQILRQLREDIGDTFTRMAEVFLDDIPAKIQSMKTAVAVMDGAALSEHAHCLKGAARSLGAGKLGDIARELEELGMSGSLQDGNDLMGVLEFEFERVKMDLQREILVTDTPCHVSRGEPSVSDEHKPLILVADDDRTLRFALNDVLRLSGFRVIQAGTGVQALAACGCQMPNLILMDAKMPEMDGFTVCSKIREMPGGVNVPILIITASDDECSIDQAFSAGATDYITKPLHFSVLRQRVSRLLEMGMAEKQMNQLAYHDVLTGLPNRALFMERIESILNDPDKNLQIHAVLFLDLDRFKLINDTMGHDTGDLILKAAAERIHSCIRGYDLVSRFGGDEFTLLLENIGSPQIAATVAEKICISLSKPFSFMAREFYITSSIGISLYPADGADGGLLIKHADTAMYRAKERGNTYCYYEASMAQIVSSKLELEGDLRRALERNEFLLHYQPQVDIRTGEIIGVEALIRWNHPQAGMVSPARFIPVAEETGLIEKIGEWVLREACRQNKEWQRAGLHPFPVAVNLSARQMEREDIADTVLSVLHDAGLPPCYLELELTESAVMKDPERTRRILQRLRQAGVQISIDDFGTGYSSLSHLKHFPFDKLKIDQSFIREIPDSSDDAAIVLTIIAIARSLKLKVIAEGVENLEQLSYLKDGGCDEMQGYFFSKPLPPADIPPLAEREYVKEAEHIRVLLRSC